MGETAKIVLIVFVILSVGCSSDNNDDMISICITKCDDRPQILIKKYPQGQVDSWYGDGEAISDNDAIIAQRVVVKHTSPDVFSEVLSISVQASSANNDGVANNMTIRIKSKLPFLLDIRNANDVVVNASQPTEYPAGEHVIHSEVEADSIPLRG